LQEHQWTKMILFLIVLIKEKAKLSTFPFQLLERKNNLILPTEFG